jgi:3'(2'), 5'-bisphosphate nucleotidase
MNNALPPLLGELARIALDAGRAVLEVYEGDAIKVERKDDKSPVTEADVRAEKVILAGLDRIAPDTAVISEEAVAGGKTPEARERFFLVDPLDGTKEFINRNGEFTVNIALVSHGRPVAGVVLAPAIGQLYLGHDDRAYLQQTDAASVLADGAGARISPPRPIRARPIPPAGLIAVASRSHLSAETEAFLAEHDIAKTVNAGSSLKFCLVAAGEADLYPRHGTTMEWDTAAGQAVLEAAGGSVRELDGRPLRYGKFDQGLVNPWFIARGRG